MIKISVTIPKLKQFQSALKKWPTIAIPELDKAIKTSIIDIRAETVVKTPIRTGRLRGSFVNNFTPLRGELYPTVYYAPFVHEGTQFIKPNPFMRYGLDAAQAKVKQNFINALEAITQKVADAANH